MLNRDPHAWMWAEALGLLERADRLRREFGRLAHGANVQGPVCWEPPADVVETAREVLVIVALPGVEPDRVHVRADGNGTFEVTGERGCSVDDLTRTVHCLEIPYGRFERRIALPSGKYQLVEQSSRDGCLRLRLQKL